jgi:hypothetical protein
MNKIILIIIFLGVVFNAAPLVSAATFSARLQNSDEKNSTASANGIDETTQETLNELKKRIEKNSERVKGVINSLLQRPRGMIGEVQRVTEETVTIRTQEGAVILQVSEGVVISRQNKAIPVDDVAIGNWAVVVGVEKDDAFSPRQISVSATSLRPNPQVVRLGVLTEVSPRALLMMSRSSGETLPVSLTAKTKFEDVNGEAAKLSDFHSDMHILLVGWETDDGVEAVRIRSLVSFEQNR